MKVVRVGTVSFKFYWSLLVIVIETYPPTFAKINTTPRAAADTHLRTEMSGALGVCRKVSHTHHEILLNIFETRKSVLFSI